MTIKESVMAGVIPEGLRILDSHAHLGEGEQGGLYIRTLHIAESLRLSKKIGIGAIVASSLKALYGNCIDGNERMMEFTKELSANCRVSWVASRGVMAAVPLLRIRENRNSVKYPCISWVEPKGALEKSKGEVSL